MSPRSRARPTTPTFATGSTSSGNKLTTPIRYMSLVPVVHVPGDDHDACLDVQPCTEILARSTRRERFALDRDRRPDQLDRGIAIVDAAELDQNALLLAFARLDLDSAPSAALLEDPTAEMRDVLARFSV